VLYELVILTWIILLWVRPLPIERSYSEVAGIKSLNKTSYCNNKNFKEI